MDLHGGAGTAFFLGAFAGSALTAAVVVALRRLSRLCPSRNRHQHQHQAQRDTNNDAQGPTQVTYTAGAQQCAIQYVPTPPALPMPAYAPRAYVPFQADAYGIQRAPSAPEFTPSRFVDVTEAGTLRRHSTRPGTPQQHVYAAPPPHEERALAADPTPTPAPQQQVPHPARPAHAVPDPTSPAPRIP